MKTWNRHVPAQKIVKTPYAHRHAANTPWMQCQTTSAPGRVRWTASAARVRRKRTAVPQRQETNKKRKEMWQRECNVSAPRQRKRNAREPCVHSHTANVPQQICTKLPWTATPRDVPPHREHHVNHSRVHRCIPRQWNHTITFWPKCTRSSPITLNLALENDLLTWSISYTIASEI